MHKLINRQQGLWRVFTGAILSLWFVTGVAQETALDEIVVTATKRERSALEVPITLTTFSAEEIDAFGMRRTFDVARFTTNLQFHSEWGITSPAIYLRGIGNEGFSANAISPFGVYVDGVYIGQNIVQGFQLYDLERIEVLKGPQGTLFGRNTTGGAMIFHTRQPDVADGTNGFTRLTVGDYGRIDVDLAAGFAIGENTAVRFALQKQQHDGYFTNVNPAVPGSDEGALDTVAARLQLSWNPTDDFSMLLNVHGGESNSQMRAFKAAWLANCPPGVIPGTFQGGCTGPEFFIDTDFDFIPDTIVNFDLTDPAGFRETSLSIKTVEDVDAFGGSAALEWGVGDYTITSVTAYDEAEMVRFSDDDGNILILADDTYLADVDFMSQELRITSEYGGATEWIAGLFYYRDNVDSFVSFDARDNPDPFANGLGIGQELEQSTRSWAAFGQIVHNFGDKTELTMGLRYTWDEREGTVESFLYNGGALTFVGHPEAAAGLPLSNEAARDAIIQQPNPFFIPTYLIPRETLKNDWGEWSGRLALSYALNDDQRLYMNIARGFKGGEFNGGAAFDPDEVSLTDPEFATHYEVGYKSRLADRSVHLELAAFHTTITDQIVQASTSSPIPRLVNAAKTESTGVEMLLRYRPSEPFYLGLGVAYLDAVITDWVSSDGTDHSGNVAPQAPEWNFNGVLWYEQSLTKGALEFQADFEWNDDRHFQVENNPVLAQDAYGTVNARVTYRSGDRRLALAMFVDNVFDEEYFTNAFDVSVFAAGYIYMIGDPRTYGAELTYNW